MKSGIHHDWISRFVREGWKTRGFPSTLREIKVWIGSESADQVHGMVLQITLAIATMLGEDEETSRSVARSAVDSFQDNRSSYITLWTPKVKAGPREALSAHQAIERATAKEQHLLRSVRDLGRLAKKVDQLKAALAEAERLVKSLKSAQKEYDSCLASFLDGAKGLA